jgi:hypothetical protein
MTNQTFTRCREDQDIIEGLVPGVITFYEEIGSQKYLDSLEVSKGNMTNQKYLELYSPYYQKNPHLKTIVED